MKKKLLLVFLALFIVFEVSETTLGKGKERIERKRAEFPVTYSLVRKYEGYYSNDPKDRGGETYGGIARNFYPDWYGWRYIDLHKRRQNERVEQAEFWVKDFYLTLWVREGWGTIASQQKVNYLFEFRIHSPIGARIVQRALRECGYGIDVDGVIGEGTINAINLASSRVLLNKVKDRRVTFYNSIVRRDPTQKEFLHHWLLRAKNL